MKTINVNKEKEPSIPDVPPTPSKPPKKERDNDFTKEKQNGPTREPSISPLIPTPVPQKPNPTGKM